MDLKGKYGLIIPANEKAAAKTLPGSSKSADKRRNVFNSDSDSSVDEDKDWVKKSFKKQSHASIQQKQSVQTIRRALADDPTVYQYDELYDEMETKRLHSKESKRKDTKAKYIDSLLKTAEKRKQEDEARQERQVQKEREKEGDMFKDKEAFVTGAYRKKMEEMEKLKEEQRRKDELDALVDVTKQKDLSGFYRHLYRQQLVEPEEKLGDEVKASGTLGKPDEPEVKGEVVDKVQSPRARLRSRSKSYSPEQKRERNRTRSRDRESRRSRQSPDQRHRKHKPFRSRSPDRQRKGRDRSRERRHRSRSSSRSVEGRLGRNRSSSRDRNQRENRHRNTPPSRDRRNRSDRSRDRNNASSSRDRRNRKEGSGDRGSAYPKKRQNRSRSRGRSEKDRQAKPRTQSSEKNSTKSDIKKIDDDINGPPVADSVDKSPLQKPRRISIWEKRTVGSILEEAIARYVVRKQANSLQASIVAVN